MNGDMKKQRNIVVMVFFIVSLFLIPLRTSLAAEEWEIISSPVPTIEELTQGKVKVGDTITKENVDLVKDLLSVGVYELG